MLIKRDPDNQEGTLIPVAKYGLPRDVYIDQPKDIDYCGETLIWVK